MNPPSTRTNAKTEEQLFREMHRDLRAWNRDAPEAPERRYPLLRKLMQLFARQLADLTIRIDQTWDSARTELISTIVPEVTRWPIPAFTVLSCELSDPVITVDPDTKFYFQDKREGGETYFFTAQRTERLLTAQVKHVVAMQGDAIEVIRTSDSTSGLPKTDFPPADSRGAPLHIYMAVDYPGPSSDFRATSLFLNGEKGVVDRLNWARWLPGTATGHVNEDAHLCPGLAKPLIDSVFGSDSPLIDRVAPAGREWGGLRSSTDLFSSLNPYWVTLTDEFLASWERGPVPGVLASAAERVGWHITEPEAEWYYWIRIDLSDQWGWGDITSFPEIHANAFLALNRYEQTTFCHTAGNTVLEMELPVDMDRIVEIVRVNAADGSEYKPRHLMQSEASDRTYSLERRGNNIVLWFDFSQSVNPPPKSLHATYAVTSGLSANGIAENKIKSVYEKHPGILSVSNLIPATGAKPPKSEAQLLTEASVRLRSRGRALTFSEIRAWARTLDSRILSAECRHGVERANNGLRRNVVISLKIDREKFYSHDEVSLLKQRLLQFLKSHSPVNTHYQVETDRP